MEQICFYFAAGSPKKSFYWGVPDVPKLFVMGQSIWPLQREKKEKSCEHIHEQCVTNTGPDNR
jgi:hypothetical protein